MIMPQINVSETDAEERSFGRFQRSIRNPSVGESRAQVQAHVEKRGLDRHPAGEPGEGKTRHIQVKSANH
jgi:hypothetical protein